jgi:tetratricopeptide (TPR) repeat protein
LSRAIGEWSDDWMDSSETNETLAPTYVPIDAPRPLNFAPVLELEGLDPGTEIRGPALVLDEPADDGEAVGVMGWNDPAQLVLEPSGPGRGVAEDSTLDGTPRSTDAAPTSNRALPAAATGATVSVEREVGLPAHRPPVPGGVEAAPAVTMAPPPPPAPDPVAILYAEARAAADGGRRDEAKRLYRELLGLRPTHAGARNDLALLLDADGNHQGALAELDRALEFEPDNCELLVNRGTLLGATGRFAAAERDLKKALRLEPAHAEALFNLGVVMTKKGLWGEAVPHLRRAVELDPLRGAAHYYLGEALNHVDDLYGALAAYQRAAELQPDNPRALYGLGIIYDRLARPDDAAQMYRRSREVGRR